MPLSEHVYWVAVTFKITKQVEQWTCIRFCIKLNIPPWQLFRWFKRLQGWCNECSTNKSVAQMLQRWSRICWKWSTFWKACSEQNTWECWMYMGCNQQRSAAGSVRTRRWSGDWFQKLLCLRFWCRILAWNVSWPNSFHGFCYQSRRNIVLQLLMMMLGERCEVPRCLLWRGLRCHCLIYNVSCISYLLQ